MGTYKTFVGMDLAGAVIDHDALADAAVKRQGELLFIAAEGQDEILFGRRASPAGKSRLFRSREGVITVDPARMPSVWLKHALATRSSPTARARSFA